MLYSSAPLPPWEHQAEFDAISERYFNSAKELPEVARFKVIGAITYDVYPFLNKHFNSGQHPNFHRKFPCGNGALSPLQSVARRILDLVNERSN